MSRISVVVDPFYGKDRLFDIQDPISNRDGCLTHFAIFKEQAEARGHEVHTSDVLPPPSADICIYPDMPSEAPCPTTRNFLILYESSLIRPDNWDLKRHRGFERIFTWDDSFLDGQKYFKMNFLVPGDAPETDDRPRTRLLTQISGNKVVDHPQELYSQRVSAIRWWEKHHPSEFTFYGMGWDQPTWGPPLWKLNQVRWLKKLAPRFRNYGGKIEMKSEVLRQYKFSLCYENAFGFPGYITEKIFDCLFAGTVPVYWGPANVTDHIPSGCFIDRTRFSTHADLRDYLVSMPEEEYQTFRQNIRQFLSGPRVKPFLAPYFAEVILPFVEAPAH